jgi:predicted SPOUT superfamily RNA methylase MTH1
LRGKVEKRPYHLSIAIPSSLTVETQDPKLRAYKVGQVARAAAVFRVQEIAVFKDPRQPDAREIVTLLKYAETPQYLRKHLFGQTELLRYAGVLPPLRMPHHMVNPSLEEGQYRDGVVLRHNELIDVGTDARAWVDVGATSPLPAAETMPAGKRVTVRIYSRDGVFWCTPEKSPYYWGYRTVTYPSLTQVLAKADYAIVASVKGRSITCDLLAGVAEKLKGKVTVVFGSPDRGVSSILRDENRSLSECTDTVLNLVPQQGTMTVRTEEAVFTALALLNVAETPPE